MDLKKCEIEISSYFKFKNFNSIKYKKIRTWIFFYYAHTHNF